MPISRNVTMEELKTFRDSVLLDGETGNDLQQRIHQSQEAFPPYILTANPDL